MRLTAKEVDDGWHFISHSFHLTQQQLRTKLQSKVPIKKSIKKKHEPWEIDKKLSRMGGKNKQRKFCFPCQFSSRWLLSLIRDSFTRHNETLIDLFVVLSNREKRCCLTSIFGVNKNIFVNLISVASACWNPSNESASLYQQAISTWCKGLNPNDF